MSGICDDFKDRAVSVQLSVGAKIPLKEHPLRLPENIYGTSGEWETYSTPSRDARIKTSMLELRDRTIEFINRLKSQDPLILYSGSVDSMRAELKKIFETDTQKCNFEFTDSLLIPRVLTLNETWPRVFDLSFDPYHSPERRWGLAPVSNESSVKENWYLAERTLRNQIERKYDLKMNFTLAELMKKSKPNWSRKST